MSSGWFSFGAKAVIAGTDAMVQLRSVVTLADPSVLAHESTPGVRARPHSREPPLRLLAARSDGAVRPFRESRSPDRVLAAGLSW